MDGNILRCINNALELSNISPKGTRVSNTIPHPPKGIEERGFSLSRLARIPRTKSPPRSTERSLFLLFSSPSFSFSFFLFFQRKAPAERGKRGNRGNRRKKQYAVGRSRGGVQTPASPISRLVVKHRPIPRSCSVMQVLSASAAWILYRGASIYTTG